MFLGKNKGKINDMCFSFKSTKKKIKGEDCSFSDADILILLLWGSVMLV